MATIISVGGSGGGGGGGGENCIVVHVDDGATVVATHSSGKRYTAVAEGGVATIPVTDVGDFTITADLGGVEAYATAEVMDNFVVQLNGVYGIQRDITSSSPQWTRTDDAVGMMATASVGTAAGHSDFDKVYPWKDMKREVLPTGDVMVKIPKFYFSRYRDGNIEHIKISASPAGGLQLHPAFAHAGLEQDCIYVGAYKSINSPYQWLDSKPGDVHYSTNKRSQYRTWAHNKGAGWHQIDISTLSAIHMLILVEFAHNNLQTVIGRGYVDGNTAAIVTGTCDNVPNLTGRPAGTDGKTAVVWRGIENLWGVAWEYIDGLSVATGQYFYNNDPATYGDDSSANCTLLSFNYGTNWASSFIQEMGLDYSNPHLMLPTRAGAGSESTYVCDVASSASSSWRVPLGGGSMTAASKAGPFASDYTSASSYAGSDVSSRLIYIP